MHATIDIEGSALRFEQAAGDTVLRAALRAGVGFPYECGSGGCGSCRFELVRGEVRTLWPDAPGLTERDRKRGRHLACQSVAVGEVSIRARPSDEYVPPIVPMRRRAVLRATADITHDLREFVFESDGPASFLPGQYALLEIGEGAAIRAYSMSNLPNGAGRWEFQIRRVPRGRVTAALFDQMRPGAQVTIDGPFGLAWLRTDSPRDIVCIAGGSGLAPMIAIARGAAHEGLLRSRRLRFFYGARTAADVCGESMLASLPDADHIDYRAVVSMPEGGAAVWHGETGFVHEAVERHLSPPFDRYEFYFAGPPPMTQAVQDMLMVRHRVPFAQIHFDRFF
jgi:toluene monooxygenase electron transfer component